MKVKSKADLLQVLMAEGYTPSNRDWRFTAYEKLPFGEEMFNFCGRPPSEMYDWKDEWLEEDEEEAQAYILPQKELIYVLLDDGYLPDEAGDWIKKGSLPFSSAQFQYCGKTPPYFYKWRKRWLK